MSVVTNLILTVFLLEDSDDSPNLTQQVLAIDLGNGQHFAHVNGSPAAVGGHKALQMDIFIAAVNHLDKQALVDGLLAIDWDTEYGDTIANTLQLNVCNEDEERFTTYDLGDLWEQYLKAAQPR